MGNPLLGVVFHWLGGLASGSFYVPYKGVKKWSWETYWLVGGIFSWILCPWLFAYFMTNDLFGVLKQQSWGTLFWTYFFGLLWGFGGLTYGLTMRFLGLSLGTGVALGYCAAFGTLVPPIFKYYKPDYFVFAGSTSIVEIAKSTAGQVTLAGVGICLLGIAIAALAGYTKEQEMPAEQKQKSIKEFNFKKGIAVATFCGIMSACFAFALQAGKDINAASLAAGTNKIWTGLPALPVLLFGGFTTNFIWCVLLNIKNRSGYQYLASHARKEHAGLKASGGEHSGEHGDSKNQLSEQHNSGYELVGTIGLILFVVGAFLAAFFYFFYRTTVPTEIQTDVYNVGLMQNRQLGFFTGLSLTLVGIVAAIYSRMKLSNSANATADLKIPVLGNYLFSALAGTCWYFQFFFYTMGATQMGKYDFASWTLHMASIIIFATMWGWIFHEWKGSSKKSHLLIAGGIATLILSTCVIGVGTAMNGGKSFHDVLKMITG
jgi:L-rhamnose-H+ transport protein